MITNRGQRKSVLISATGMFRGITNGISSEVLSIMDFRPDVPSVIKDTSQSVHNGSFFRAASSESVDMARRDVDNEIFVMSDSPMFSNVLDNSSSKINITNSGRSESPKVDLLLGDDSIARKIKSSEGSKGTTETVTGQIEFVVRVKTDDGSQLSEKTASNFALVARIEIEQSLGVLDIGAKIEFHTSRKGDFIGELNETRSSSESNDNSLFSRVNKG
jgi:hypothetical protein